MKLTNSSSTGHLARFQMSTTVSPTPTRLPASLARPPLSVTPIALIAVSTISSTVSPTRSGSVFQTGRPSSMSYIAFDARMNAPM
jgi:hypothetical protein